MDSIWTIYRVRLEFLTSVCGSVPAAPELVKAWLEAREPRVVPPGAKSIEAINEEVLVSLERGEGDAPQDYALLVFQRHDGAVVVRAGTVRAHIKDCARVLSAQYVGRIQNERAFSTRVINGVYIDEREYWLPITRPDDTRITTVDGTRDKAVHVRGPRGPISALKRLEYITPPSFLSFTLKVLGESVTEDDLHKVFQYGGTHGYGGERGDGEGRYDHTLERVSAQRQRARDSDGGSALPKTRTSSRRRRERTSQP